ncbi:MAG: lactonase family protein [Myxococcota bacterium]
MIGTRALLFFTLLTAACQSQSSGPVDADSPDVSAADAQLADAGARDADAASSDGMPADAADIDAGVAPDAGPEDAGAGPRLSIAYVGSGDGNIYRAILARDGTMTLVGRLGAGQNPSFLAFDAHDHLYAVDESGPMGGVQAFAIDPTTGALRFLNRQSSAGAGPAHLSVDPSGAFVLVANYGDGNIASLPILADGSLGPAVDSRQAGSHAHLIRTDPAGRFVFVPCLGANNVAQYVFDVAQGTLSPNAIATVDSPPGAGPRHLVFHPSARWAYVINETNSSVTRYDYDAASGQLNSRDTLSTLPAGFGGSNTCAEVEVHPNGRVLYGSNRGHDSIARFSIDPASGALTAIDHTPTGGRTPRNFGLSPGAAWMLVANQESDEVRSFAVDPVSGALTPTGAVINVPRPAFVGVRDFD